MREDDLPDVYRAGHVFSLVSNRGPGQGEGLPLAVIEAAATGLPVLVGDQDGSQEGVSAGVSGHVLDPFDCGAHARGLASLARDPAARAAMGAAGRARAEREFSYARFVDEHRALLDGWFGDRSAEQSRSDPDGS